VILLLVKKDICEGCLRAAVTQPVVNDSCPGSLAVRPLVRQRGQRQMHLPLPIHLRLAAPLACIEAANGQTTAGDLGVPSAGRCPKIGVAGAIQRLSLWRQKA